LFERTNLRTVIGAALVAAILGSVLPRVTHADDESPPAFIPSPFGPGWDPTKPPPEPPRTSGPGITSVTVTASGEADIEELHPPMARASERMIAVVTTIRIPAASTTPALDAGSVAATSEDGSTKPVFAICTPTAEAPFEMLHGGGARLSYWHVTVAGRKWICGGRNARLAVELGDQGLRMKTDGAWEGPMLLFFDEPASPIRSVTVTGVNAALPPKTENETKS